MSFDQFIRWLTNDEFLALPEEERVSYLQRVTDHLNQRAASLTEPNKPPES